jgi:hypothetical protein
VKRTKFVTVVYLDSAGDFTESMAPLATARMKMDRKRFESFMMRNLISQSKTREVHD